MINLYAYSYPSAMKEFAEDGYILTKIGDSHRDTDIRIAEQGGSAEWEGKVKIGEWVGLKKIARDFDVHEILRGKGLWHKKDNAGTEWFKIPAKNAAEVFAYIDNIVTELEGERVRPNVILRKIQEQNLDKAMDIFAKGTNKSSIIANLCPRFGKTIWALMLFNRITAEYGNKVMLLPAYWLSVHSSFTEELNRYKDFADIRYIDINDPNAEETAQSYLDQGLRIIVPISLHGDLTEFIAKHQWIADIPNDDIFVFADEGDFGTHTENQVAKLDFLFNVV